jgi:FRG domain-containing protein
MENSQDVQSVRAYLERVWLNPPPSETEISLFRGQLHNHPLFPKLFRAPNTPNLVQETESRMLAFLKQASPHLLPSRPENDWDWLSLGQHYGMSTRMSDWSANPLVALFFAVELDPNSQANPLVYHYPIKLEIVEKLKKDSPLTIRNTRVFQPHHSHRSEAQAAWHVVHAIHKSERGPLRFYALDKMPPHNERIAEIKISKQHVAAIRAELSKMGMTHSTIYGDFGSVCRSIAPSFGLS